MSRTRHHRNQRHTHGGEDYGSRYNCDKSYASCYGVDGRNRADRERRNEGKRIIRNELNRIGSRLE